MRITRVDPERLSLKYEELIEGEVYLTNGGLGDEPDGDHYLKLDESYGIASLDSGSTYSEADYNIHEWMFWPTDAELLVK